MSLRLQTLAQRDIRLYIPSRPDRQACNVHRLRLEFQECAGRGSKERTGADGRDVSSVVFDRRRFIKVFHDSSLDEILVEITGIDRETAFLGLQSNSLHHLLEELDTCLAAFRRGEFQKDLFVAFNDYDEARVAWSEGFLRFETVNVS